jgi:hypothetical protein
MALDAGDIRVAGTAHIYFAPLLTTFPAFDEVPDPDDWDELGYVTTDGLTLTFGREVTEIYAMQSLEPVRVIATKVPKTVGFSLMQEGRSQLIMALGGGTFTTTGVAPDIVYKYEPPDASVIDERSMIVQMLDGTNEYRWYYKRCQNREGVEHKYVREDAATFPVSMQILAPTDESAPFYLETNDPAYAVVP